MITILHIRRDPTRKAEASDEVIILYELCLGYYIAIRVTIGLPFELGRDRRPVPALIAEFILWVGVTSILDQWYSRGRITDLICWKSVSKGTNTSVGGCLDDAPTIDKNLDAIRAL